MVSCLVFYVTHYDEAEPNLELYCLGNLALILP